MAIIRVYRKMVPMSKRVRRVGCKKSVPNRKNLPPFKELLAELIGDESQESFAISAMWVPVSHKKTGKELTSDLKNKLEEVTAEIAFSAEGNNSNLEDIPLHQDTVDVPFSAEGGDSGLQDLSLQKDTAQTLFSATGGYPDLQDMPYQQNTAKSQFSAKGDHCDLRAMPFQHSTAETHLSAEAGDSDLQGASFEHDTAVTHFSAKGSESYVPDTYLQYDAAEGSNDVEEASEGVSPINKWACRVCMGAEVSIAVLPCHHLCLCLDCEPECDKCPVCGGPKNHCFYMSS